MRLWVDDERPAPDDSWVVAKTSDDAAVELWWHDYLHQEPVEEISLDHDLGGSDTGMKVLDWIISTNQWPRVLTIHTSNPPARSNMLRAANAEAPASVEINTIVW